MKGILILRRFFAFIVDLSLGHFLFFLLLPFSAVDALMESILDFLRSYKGLIDLFHVDIVYLGSLLGIYIFTYLVKFYSTLVFGRSFGQFLMFFKSSGGHVWGRVGGALRELSGLLLTPFILFDIPLVKGESIKEKVTASALEDVSGEKKMIFSYVIGFFILGLSFFGPLFYHMTVVDGLKVSFNRSTKTRISNQSQFDKFELYKSYRFTFETFSDLSAGRFVLLPDFEIIKQRDNSRINPFIKIFDNKTKSVYHLYLGKPYSLLKILKKGSIGNFLFASKYPLVAQAIEEEPIYKRWPAVKNQKVKKLFSKELITEIQALVESSMEIGYGNLISHIFNNGPFIRGHVELRNTLLDIVEEGVSPEVDIIEFGNNSFLRFRHEFKNFENLDSAFQETLIPIDTPYSQVLVLTCERCKGDFSGLEEFKKKFFGGAQWMFDYQQLHQYPQSHSQVNSLSIVDYLNHTKMNGEQLLVFEEGIYNLVFAMAKSALESGDKDLQFETGETIRKISMVMATVNNIKKDYYSKKIIHFLESIKASLANGDKRFFNIEASNDSN